MQGVALCALLYSYLERGMILNMRKSEIGIFGFCTKLALIEFMSIPLVQLKEDCYI